ncbi:helix-turn-helix domain-containing protein [Frankia sp. Cj3]|uniref:helix-turn-helix domain-containing protein n=1 Tax=Frankia sp. Cj3 TaxID=2880976 RepID=UPI001EF4C44D|nr:helix-turn-helix domain-containing protein [Frankia sp. Cj3]
MPPFTLGPYTVSERLLSRDDMRAALAARDFGAAFRLMRKYDGASQDRIASGVEGLSQSRVSKIMRGEDRIATLDLIERITDALRIPGALLGLAPRPWEVIVTDARSRPTPSQAPARTAPAQLHNVEADQRDSVTLLNNDDTWTPHSTEELADLLGTDDGPPVHAANAARLAHEWLIVEPPQIIEIRAGRRIGTGLLHKVEGRVAHLRKLDDFIGGKDLNSLVERELTATIDLLRTASYDERLGRRLLSAIAELCQLAGWVAMDAGLPIPASRYFTGGVKAAHAANDQPVAANLISTLSYQVANQGEPADAVLLSHTAYQGARRTATATTLALLKERVAWAHAKVGELKNAEKALAEVDRLYEQRRPDDDPTWVYWLNEDEINIMKGRCYVELTKPRRAEPLLTNALKHYNDDHAREVALYETWLAEVHIQKGDIDQACAKATRALLLDARTNSTRSSERVQTLRAKLRPYADSHAVQEFEELYRSTIETSEHD